jgi:crotonobetainyl-CoA:carnitine CoA-transferase CaiB-like acyl-CoA transferase
MTQPAALDGLRALDLTNETGISCARVLADYGVDVIKIEPPGGSKARGIGPFYQNSPHPDKSLFWSYYSANKRGITLDIEKKESREILGKLVKTADFVIEDFQPGYLTNLGIGYKWMEKIKSDIILTSITPFGQDGPYKDYKGSDLICWSMGGYTWMVGDEDRPPVQISYPQAYLHSSAEAAAATLIGYYHRLITGEGQHIDVSMQACVFRDLMNAPLFYEINKVVLKRSGPFRVGLTIGAKQRLHWRCKDGYVTYLMMGGAMGARDNKALTEFMIEKNACPDFLKQIDWKNFNMAGTSQEFIDKVDAAREAFFLRFTKRELFDEAIRRHMTIYPVATVEDIAKDKQLEAREFWETVETPETGKMKYPGALARLSETPCVKRQHAPHVGEHNQEVFTELGYSLSDLNSFKQAGVI